VHILRSTSTFPHLANDGHSDVNNAACLSQTLVRIGQQENIP
jgi:hypothetical protein